MILYSKFNPQRKKQFQLCTTIENIDSKLFSVKTATHEEARQFLESFFQKYNLLKESGLPFCFVAPEKIQENKVHFSFIEKETLDTKLFQLVQQGDKKAFIAMLQTFYDLLKKVSVEECGATKDSADVFGWSGDEVFDCLPVGCMDLNFGNIIWDDEIKNIKVFDYEWTFSFPIPYRYVFFRSVSTFYSKYIQYDLNKSIASISNIFEIFHFTKKEQEKFITFEYHFQKYVNDDIVDEKVFSSYYEGLKMNYSPTDYIENKEREISILHNDVLQKNNEIQQQSSIIAQQQIMIQEQQSIIQQKEEVIQEKSSEIALIKSSKFWKLRHKYLRIKSRIFSNNF